MKSITLRPNRCGGDIIGTGDGTGIAVTGAGAVTGIAATGAGIAITGTVIAGEAAGYPIATLFA
jgi:hypothetical protein